MEAADLIKQHDLGYVFKHGDVSDFKKVEYLSNPETHKEFLLM